MATAGLKIWKWVLCHSKVNRYHCWVKQFFWSTYFPRISDKISRIHFSVIPIFQKLIKYTAGMNLPPGSLVWDFLEGHGVQNTHIDVTSYALVYTACSDYMQYRFFLLWKFYGSKTLPKDRDYLRTHCADTQPFIPKSKGWNFFNHKNSILVM